MQYVSFRDKQEEALVSVNSSYSATCAVMYKEKVKTRPPTTAGPEFNPRLIAQGTISKTLLHFQKKKRVLLKSDTR